MDMAVDVLSTVVLILSIGSIFRVFAYSRSLDIRVSDSEVVAGQFRYQLLLMALASFTLFVLFLLNGEVLTGFLSPGEIDAVAEPVPVLGIGEGESWSTLGVGLSFSITLVTSIFVYLRIRPLGDGLRRVLALLGWVCLLALGNSLSEEALFRLGLVTALYGAVSPFALMAISGVVFGLAHYRGEPGGVTGMFMAGVLGWLSMKSVLETHGMFWAWFIHFLQDVVIFLGMVVVESRLAAAASKTTG